MQKKRKWPLLPRIQPCYLEINIGCSPCPYQPMILILSRLKVYNTVKSVFQNSKWPPRPSWIILKIFLRWILVAIYLSYHHAKFYPLVIKTNYFPLSTSAILCTAPYTCEYSNIYQYTVLAYVSKQTYIHSMWYWSQCLTNRPYNLMVAARLIRFCA